MTCEYCNRDTDQPFKTVDGDAYCAPPCWDAARDATRGAKADDRARGRADAASYKGGRG